MSLVFDSSPDRFRINDFPFLLGTDCQSIGHQVVNQSGISLSETMRSGQGCRINDACGCPCQLKLVQDVSGDFVVRQSGIVVMDSDPLAQCLMNWFSERVIKMGFSAQDQCKVINRVVAVVHEHLDVIQDSGIQVLCFINGEEKRLAFFFVKIGDLFLDSLEHPGFAAFFRNSKNEAKLLVKVSNADGGETQVFHMEQAWI